MRDELEHLLDDDEDMAEMIAFEIDSLSAKLKELEENIKVFV